MERKKLTFHTSKELAERIKALLSISILAINGITCATKNTGNSIKVTVKAPEKELLSASHMIAAFFKEERTDMSGHENKQPKTPKPILEIITKAHAEYIKPPQENISKIPFARLA